MFSLLKSVFIEQYSKYKHAPQIMVNNPLPTKNHSIHMSSPASVESINKGGGRSLVSTSPSKSQLLSPLNKGCIDKKHS